MPFLLPLNKPNSHSLPPRILFSNPLIQWCTLVLSFKLLKIACCQMAVSGDPEQTPTWEASVSPPWTTSVESEESSDYSLAPPSRVGGGTLHRCAQAVTEYLLSNVSHWAVHRHTADNQTDGFLLMSSLSVWTWVTEYVCVSVCVYVSVSVYMCVYVCVSVCLCVLCVYMCICVCLGVVCLRVCVCICLCECACVCTRARMPGRRWSSCLFCQLTTFKQHLPQ